MTELTLPDPTKYLHRMVKRLEKKGYIFGKVKGATYRKVKILQHKTKNAKLVIFKIGPDREMKIEIDMLSAALCPSAYFNNTFNDIKVAVEEFNKKAKEAPNVTSTHA